MRLRSRRSDATPPDRAGKAARSLEQVAAGSCAANQATFAATAPPSRGTPVRRRTRRHRAGPSQFGRLGNGASVRHKSPLPRVPRRGDRHKGLAGRRTTDHLDGPESYGGESPGLGASHHHGRPPAEGFLLAQPSRGDSSPVRPGPVPPIPSSPHSATLVTLVPKSTVRITPCHHRPWTMSATRLAVSAGMDPGRWRDRSPWPAAPPAMQSRTSASTRLPSPSPRVHRETGQEHRRSGQLAPLRPPALRRPARRGREL